MATPTLAVTEQGSGEPFLILHGLLGSGRNWGYIMRDLSPFYHVIVPDLPNHGGSSWTDSMDYPDQARAVADWIGTQSFAGKPLTLLGHSMGGKLAMTLALTQPHLIDRLIIADMAPVSYNHNFGALTRAMKAVPLHSVTKRSDVENHLAQSIDNPRVRAFVLQNLEITPQGYRWRPNLDLIERSQAPIMGFPDFGEAQFAGKTLFISGAQSDYVLPSHHSQIKKLFPKVSLVSLPDCGHWIHADQPQAFVEAIRRFMGA